MTAVEQVEWAVGDPCFYRASQYPGPPSPATVSRIDGEVLTITTVGGDRQSYLVFPDEITRREL